MCCRYIGLLPPPIDSSSSSIGNKVQGAGDDDDDARAVRALLQQWKQWGRSGKKASVKLFLCCKGNQRLPEMQLNFYQKSLKIYTSTAAPVQKSSSRNVQVTVSDVFAFPLLSLFSPRFTVIPAGETCFRHAGICTAATRFPLSSWGSADIKDLRTSSSPKFACQENRKDLVLSSRLDYDAQAFK